MGGHETVSREDYAWDTAPWFMHQGHHTWHKMSLACH